MNLKTFSSVLILLITCFTIEIRGSCFLLPQLHTTQEHSPIQPKEPILNPTPYLLPSHSPLHHILHKIFANPEVMKNEHTFTNAGFITLFLRSRGNLRIARHPKLKNYLFKLYLTEEAGLRMKSRQNALIRRCTVAAGLRRLIHEHKLRYITVPDKWLYEVANPAHPHEKLFVLIVQDMRLVSREKSKAAWKTKVTRRHLRELYCVLRHGYASLAIDQNISYTKSKTFSCIDTEYLPRNFELEKVKKYFSKKMRRYWDALLTGEN